MSYAEVTVDRVDIWYITWVIYVSLTCQTISCYFSQYRYGKFCSNFKNGFHKITSILGLRNFFWNFCNHISKLKQNLFSHTRNEKFPQHLHNRECLTCQSPKKCLERFMNHWQLVGEARGLKEAKEMDDPPSQRQSGLFLLSLCVIVKDQILNTL